MITSCCTFIARPVTGMTVSTTYPTHTSRPLYLNKIWEIYFLMLSTIKPCPVIAEENFRSRRWGSSLTVCARMTVRSSPHRHKRKFSSARVCRVTFKHLPQPLRSHIRSFGTLRQLFKKPTFSAQKSHSAGGRGGPPIIFLVGILIFLLLRSSCKISKPYDKPFWEIEQ